MDYRQRIKMQAQARKKEPAAMDTSFARRSSKQIEDARMNRVTRRKRKNIVAVVFSWAFQILLVIMIAYMLVYFFGQARTNIGQSMDTTLTGGDVVLINMLSYSMDGPERGDIISFKPGGNDSSRSSIKRVVGLPGETIQIVDGLIQIDGKTYLEQKDFPVMSDPGIAAQPIKLSSTEYFVLGDNRNNSEDSRYAEIGLVTSDMIEGKVWFILSPSAHRGFLKK